MAYLENAYRNNIHKFKGALLKLYLNLHGCKVGKKLKCKRWPIFRITPKGNITIGDHVTIGYHITFEARPTGSIVIGDHVLLSQNVLISSSREVKIGDWCGVSENVSIRDQMHMMQKGKPYLSQRNISEPVSIGKDVWIGAGSIILMGSRIADSAVIGANSVISGKLQTEEDGIYSGNPPELVGKRK